MVLKCCSKIVGCSKQRRKERRKEQPVWYFGILCGWYLMFESY